MTGEWIKHADGSRTFVDRIDNYRTKEADMKFIPMPRTPPAKNYQVRINTDDWTRVEDISRRLEIPTSEIVRQAINFALEAMDWSVLVDEDNIKGGVPGQKYVSGEGANEKP